MPTSEARIIANRNNASKSTGPSTPAGLRRSSSNSLKHGMTGRGIVVLEEDRDEIERRNEALQAELGPKSTLGQIMVGQMATLSVRMERGARQESAAIDARVRHADELFDEARLDEAEQLFGGIANEPRVILRKLLKSPEGVDRLILAWQELRADLTFEGQSLWSVAHLEKAVSLGGLRIEEAQGSSIVVLSKAVLGDFAGLADRDGGILNEEGRKAWAQGQLVERIDGQIAGLQAHYETLDFETINLDRAGAGDRALFDPSKEAALARRYESEARRGFFKALKEFRRAELEAADRAELAPAPAPAPEVAQPGEPLGSFCERPTPTLRDPQPVSNRPSSPMSQPLFDRDGQPLATAGVVPTAG
jgi:hypothetical protein